MKLQNLLLLLGVTLTTVHASKKGFKSFIKDAIKATEDIKDFLEDADNQMDQIIAIVDNMPEDGERAKENAKIAYNYFDSIVEQHEDITYLPIKNTTCITRHCSGYIAACLGDDVCRQNMACAGDCGSDSACTIQCSYSYQAHTIDDMMSCLFVDYECLSLPPPDPINNATCRFPENTVQTIDNDLLAGDWYIVAGFNPLYDCFDCQVSTYSVVDGKLDYSALFNMPAANGTEIWPTDEMLGDDVSTPGLMIFDEVEFGLPHHQEWYVMHLDEDTMMSYYCGDSLDSWHFEGFVVMSRTMELNPDKMAVMDDILASLEIDQSDICWLKVEEACARRPSEFEIFLQ